jgi:Tol biopolymer transport system component
MRPGAHTWRFVLLGFAACAISTGGAGPAVAAFPGLNGKIAFAHFEGPLPGIVAMNADGSGQTVLIGPVSNFPSWSPNGRRIAYVALDSSSAPQVFIASSDGSGATQFTTGSGSTTPDWSPDGQKIVFMSNTASKSAIFSANVNGTGLTPLTAGDPGDDVRPAWSPDGTKIAFVRGTGNQAEIYVMTATGAAQTPLTSNSAFEDRPSWSPDGTKIAFTSGRGGNDDVYVMNADGSGQRALTTGPAAEFDPAWSPDGTKIVFASVQGSTSSINVMNADGSGQTPLTSGVDNAPVWQPLAPPPAHRCIVPKVKGKTLAAARRAIKHAHCKAGKVSKAFSKKVRRGRVLSQKPRAGKRLPQGSKVSLVVSKGRKP